MQKLKNSVKPNIYECKICGEHHCEHEFPEEQSVQEMTPIMHQPPVIILQAPPPGNVANRMINGQRTNENHSNETHN